LRWPFRDKVQRDLQDAYVCTRISAIALPLLFGAYIGIFTAAVLHVLLSVAVVAALIVPHGLFEVSALLMPGASCGTCS